MDTLAPPGTESEDAPSSIISKKNSEIGRLLAIKTTLPDGTYGKVFERTYQNGIELWYCKVCKCPVMGQMFNHEAGKRHSTCMEMSQNRRGHGGGGLVAQRSASPKNELGGVGCIGTSREDLRIAPGEPVPPGFEGEITKVAQIQKRLNNFKTSSLIGLEYLLELQDYDQEKEPSYLCVLCGKKGDFRTIIPHLVSYKHLQCYIQRHYPKTFAALLPFSNHRKYKKAWHDTLTKVAEAIENKYGRLLPHPIDVDTFERKKNELFAMVQNGPHFSELNGTTFEHLVDKDEIIRVSNEAAMDFGRELDDAVSQSALQNVQAHNIGVDASAAAAKLKRPRSSLRRRDLSPASSISSDEFDPFDSEDKRRPKNIEKVTERKDLYNRRICSPPPAQRNRDRNILTLPWLRSDYMRKDLAQEAEKKEKSDRGESKREEFRRLASAIENDMERQLREQRLNPEKHPQYNEEWKVFWNKRYKELQNEGKDTQKYDFKPEWIVYWNKKMDELHKVELKLKVDALRRRLGLPDIAPISFRIASSGVPSSNSRKRRTSSISEVKPVAAQPDQDHEVIVIDDNDKDDIRSRPKNRSRSREKDRRSRSRDRRSRSHSPWESDVSSSRRVKSPFRDRRRKRYSRSRSRSKSRSRSRSHSRNRSNRKSSTTHSRSRYSPQIRREVDSSKKLDSWERDVVYQDQLGRLESQKKDTILVRESVLKKQEAVDQQLSEMSGDVNVVGVLRLLTALEDKLGSLGPKVVDLLAKALAMEKKQPNSAETLLEDEPICVVFETIKEKLKGLLHAGLVGPMQEKAIKAAVTKIAGLMYASTKAKEAKDEQASKVGSGATSAGNLKVAGIGSIDKTAIAKQIATALVLQGKTDVSQNELEQLINAVVGMAEASKTSSKPITTASFLEMVKGKSSEVPKTTGKSLTANVSGAIPAEKSTITEKQQSVSEKDAMDGLSDLELQTLLQSFKDLSSEEQHGLISYLKKLEAKEPARVETLRKFVNLDSGNSAPPPKEEEKGRISPFSMKLSTSDLFPDKVEKPEMSQNVPKLIDSDDEDYSYEDVFKAANQNVQNTAALKPAPNKRDTAEGVSDLIANIMVSMANKTPMTNTTKFTTSGSNATNPSSFLDPAPLQLQNSNFRPFNANVNSSSSTNPQPFYPNYQGPGQSQNIRPLGLISNPGHYQSNVTNQFDQQQQRYFDHYNPQQQQQAQPQRLMGNFNYPGNGGNDGNFGNMRGGNNSGYYNNNNSNW